MHKDKLAKQMNILSEDNNHLARLNYEPLLTKILELLGQNDAFTWSKSGEQIYLFPSKIAEKICAQKIEHPLMDQFGTRSATINLSEQNELSFNEKIREIYQVLSEKISPFQAQLFNLVREQSSLKVKKPPSELGFYYDFPSNTNLKQKRLGLQISTKGSDASLKAHLLGISVKNINSFTDELRQSITNHYQKDSMIDAEQQEEIEEKLEKQFKNSNSSFYKLRNLVFEETIGKLKKEAKILYLEYIKDNIEDKKNPDLIYLQELIERLRLLEQYLNDPSRADSEYNVNYEGCFVNFRDIFARAESLDRLPIISVVEGNLGESTQIEQGSKEFVFCLKMKLNGNVTNQFEKSVSVLDFNLQILNPDSKEHQQALNSNSGRENFVRKLLQTFLLYYFVFSSPIKETTEKYDPIAKYNRMCLEILQNNDQEEKKELLRKFLKAFKIIGIENKVSRVKKLIQENLKKTAISQSAHWSIYLGLSRNILADAADVIEQDNLVKTNITNSKEYLKYITVGPSKVNENNLSHLPVQFTIEDMRYFPTEEEQSLSQTYSLDKLKFLPVIIWNNANKNDIVYREYQKYFVQEKHISIPYNNTILNGNKTSQSFFYKFTFSLLVYIFLKIIINQLKLTEDIFIGILRLQRNGKDNPPADEEFMYHFSKTLDHLLSQEVLAKSQGINIKNINRYKIQNALSSLYIKLPKVFRFNQYKPELKRLAIIVISSRESDRNYKEDTVLSNLMGEVITLDCQEDQIYLRNLRTFSANDEKSKMYQRPALLIDQVNDLYRRGYLHIFYIAKTPYSSSLNLSQKDEDDFFMSKLVLGCLKGDKSDLKIYPIFFDKYHVKKMKSTVDSTAFYVKDSRELDKLVHDSSKQTVIFFNLFSGISVGKDNNDDKFYHGVISYATLLNVYQGVLQEQDIRQGLIHDDNENQLKNDLLNFLTLVHYARFEARANSNIKLDPYEDIIGDSSVSAHSIFNHSLDSNLSIYFNSLAFLTEIRNILNANAN